MFKTNSHRYKSLVIMFQQVEAAHTVIPYIIVMAQLIEGVHLLVLEAHLEFCISRAILYSATHFI